MAEEKNVLILGRGGFGTELAELLTGTGLYQKVYFLDDGAPDCAGRLDDLERPDLRALCPDAFAAVGNNALRLDLLRRLREAGYNLPVFVHPRAFVCPSAQLGEGTVVLPLCWVGARTVAGMGCILNAGASIVWQQTWAYARTSDHGDFGRYGKDQQQMYDAIVASVQRLLEETSIETVIPSGTAIQNLRTTELCDSLDLTRDGYHLGLGAGRYTAACAWFQTLVAPALGTNVADNACRLEGTPYALTPQEAELCREAVRKACIRWNEVWKTPTGTVPVGAAAW